MVKGVFALLSAATARDIPLATFDGAKGTTLTWTQKNDPVMGGQSTGTFTVENNAGVFDGTCKIVPFLGAPGFIKAETSKTTLPDVRSCSGLALTVKSTTDYDGFRFSFGTKRSDCGKFFATGHKANFKAPKGDFETVQIPFTDFTDCWDDGTGDAIKTCADDAKYCPDDGTLTNMQTMSVWAEGKEGDVHLEIKSVVATGCDSEVALSESAEGIPLTTFDGAEATTQRWTAMNDPVMGGQSKATFAVDNNAGVFDGAVAIVPSLQAPGFCTMQSPRGSFPDISAADALEVVARQTSDYKGWRFTIGDAPRNPDSGAPFFVKGTYKANVAIPASEEFQTVTIPFTDFTYKWSDTTGEPTVKCVDDASVCPTAKYLKTPKQLTITAEGVEGSFHLEVKSITAVNMATKERAVLV